MDDSSKRRVLDYIAEAVGNEAFDRLVGSVREIRHQPRLRFWQDELLARAGVSIASVEDFVALFDGVELRVTGRSKDALAAATATFWTPLLREHGFKRYAKRSFGRCTHEGIFQLIGLHLSSYGDKSFSVEYSSMLTTRHREVAGSTNFRRLPRGKSNGGWWNAKSHKHADESMREVCEKTGDVAIPWFEATSSTAGLADELLVIARGGNPHTFFELGCCYAVSGDLEAATPILRQAIHGFQTAFEEMPKRTWAERERLRAQELVDAIAVRKHQSLLTKWQAETIRTLKLEKLLARPDSNAN